MIYLSAKINLKDSDSPFLISRRNLLSISTQSFDRDDISNPSFGLRSNTTNITFKDEYGTIENYAKSGVLTKDQKVEVFISDTLAKKTQKVSTAYTEDWQYDYNSKEVIVKATDGLLDWQEINVPRIDIDLRKDNRTDMLWLYEYLREIANSKSRIQVATAGELDKKTIEALRSVYIVYPILYEGSLWASFSKLCLACFLHLYVDADGVAKPFYTYGD